MKVKLSGTCKYSSPRGDGSPHPQAQEVEEGQQQRLRKDCPGLLSGRHRCSHKDRLCSAWPGHRTPVPAHTASLQSTGCGSVSHRNQLTCKPLAGARCGGVRYRSRERKNGQGGVYTPGTRYALRAQSTREGPETLVSQLPHRRFSRFQDRNGLGKVVGISHHLEG